MNRKDHRKNDEIRPISIQEDFLSHPIASVLISTGGTKVVCAVSMDPSVPGWMRAQKVSGGWVTAEYGMLPASTHDRMQRESIKGKPSGRTMEIQRLIGRSFRSVIDLQMLGPNTISIDCDVIDADGGTRTASISGASAALYIAFERMKARGMIAQNPMRELVAAVSVGIIKGEICADLNYLEDSSAETDMNVVMTESGKFIEVQGTAERNPFSAEELQKILKMAEAGLKHMFKAQHAAIDRALKRNTGKSAPLSTLGDVFDKALSQN